MRRKVQAGGIPEQPSGRISNSFWSLLEECWDKIPAKRPPIVKLYCPLSNPTAVTEDLPEKLGLRFLSLFPSDEARRVVPNSKDVLYLKINYGEMSYKTPLMTKRVRVITGIPELRYVYACFCPPLPLSPTQLAVQTGVGDRYKLGRQYAVGLLGIVRLYESPQERQSSGNREFLHKSLTTTQQILSVTRIQLFNKSKEFPVRLDNREDVNQYWDLRIRLERL